MTVSCLSLVTIFCSLPFLAAAADTPSGQVDLGGVRNNGGGHATTNEALTAASHAESPAPVAGAAKWWKGSIHIHSAWSDGYSHPEMVAMWYRSHGYQFINVSDHNVVQKGERWKPVEDKNRLQCDEYRSAFGTAWIEERGDGAKQQIRCKQLSEYRSKFEVAGKFLIMSGEEITCKVDGRNGHVVVLNTEELIKDRNGSNLVETLDICMDSVRDMAEKTKREMVGVLCHPNWGSGPGVEEFWPNDKIKFFEVVNQWPSMSWNVGDEKLLSTDRMWDIALTKRMESGINTPLYGVAADDMHKLETEAGISWIMVRADDLTAGKIVEAMNRGNFYASTGVTLKDYGMRDGQIFVEIEPEPGVEYTTQFIGTAGTYDRSMESAKDGKGELLPPTKRFSKDLGKVLAESRGTFATYKPSGGELYVRAKVISSSWVTRKMGKQSAWIQPIRLTSNK